jgi:5-formyltetrahydrofolate cyclo-ligase
LPSDPLIERRNELRNTALALRNAIPENMREAYSQLIRKRTIEFLNSHRIKFIHTYIGFQSEVQTRGIIQDCFERGIKVAVPIVRGEGTNQHMIHSLLENLDNLRPGKFGVPEPEIVKEVSVDVDAIIIPVVAFDGFGMRLGYGKGFYDKLLATFSPKINRIGLAFSPQEMDMIPMLSHDQLMNVIITEKLNFFFK